MKCKECNQITDFCIHCAGDLIRQNERKRILKIIERFHIKKASGEISIEYMIDCIKDEIKK